MSFSNMLDILKEKDKEHLIIIKLGVFYIATGKDAVFLNNQLSLKCVCFKKQVCKVGIPENRLEYYIEKLNRLNISYIVYNFDDKKEKLIQKYRHDGVYHKEKNENRNCLICKGIRMYSEDKYMNAVQKLLEEEIHNNAE